MNQCRIISNKHNKYKIIYIYAFVLIRVLCDLTMNFNGGFRGMVAGVATLPPFVGKLYHKGHFGHYRAATSPFLIEWWTKMVMRFYNPLLSKMSRSAYVFCHYCLHIGPLFLSTMLYANQIKLRGLYEMTYMA